MLFTSDAKAGLADGTLTLTFRTWVKPQAKAGGRYRTCGLLLEVDSITQVDPAQITDDEAQRAGSQSADALRQRLRLKDGDAVWRVEFHYVGPDDRIEHRNDELDSARLGLLTTRLNRLDRASKTGPWTNETLWLIQKHPGVVSTELAHRINMERQAFKINVRKLKELGLTESLEVGYRLSPLGEAFLAESNRG